MNSKAMIAVKGLTCLAVCLVGALAFAGSTTQPVRGGRGGAGGGGAGDPKARPNWPDSPGDRPFVRDVSDADLAASDQFFKEHTPNSWASIQKRPEKDRVHARHMLAQRFLALRAMQSNPDEQPLYDNKIKQVELEDQLFMMIGQVKDASPATQAAGWADDLRKKVAELVQLRLVERTLRVDRLKQAVDQEVARLAADKANSQEIVDAWFAEAMKGDMRPLRGGERTRGPGRDGPKPPKPATNPAPD